MEIKLRLETDTYNSNPTDTLVISGGHSGRVYLKLSEKDREISVPIRQLRKALELLEDEWEGV